MKQIPAFVSVLLAAAILGSACIPSAPATPQPGLEETLAIRTMVAIQGAGYFASPTPSPMCIKTQPTANNQLIFGEGNYPSATPIPSLTPIGSSVAALSHPAQCENQALFVKDITYADYSEIKPGQKFTKTWQLRNTGDCTWTPDYSLVFSFGDKMDGQSPNPIGASVPPGATVNVSINLVAPKVPSYYQGNWILQDNYGRTFTCGSGTHDYIWVSVLVGEKVFKSIDVICGGGG